MKLAYFYVTEQGKNLAQLCNQILPGDCYGKENLRETLKAAMKEYDGIVCIMATGIVVRMIAEQIVHKSQDPAVIVMDQKGKYCISLLSGHLGGANELAKALAQITGGEPVITTATDVEGQISFDVFAKQHGLVIENIEQLKYVSGALLQGKKIKVICSNPKWKHMLQGVMKETGGLLLEDVEEKESGAIGVEESEGEEREIGVVISHRLLEEEKKKGHFLYLRPKVVTVGIGCKKDRNEEGADEAIKEVLQNAGISPLSVKQLATIQRKAEEPVVAYLRERYQLGLCVVEEERIKQLDLERLGIATSSFVKETVGVASVSTACAYLGANEGSILVDKEKFQGMTLSVAVEKEDTKEESCSFFIQYGNERK